MSVPTQEQQDTYNLAKHYEATAKKPGKSKGEKMTLQNMAACLYAKINKLV